MISGRVIGKEIDENGNIKIATQYTLTDGSKKTGYTRYNARNFSEAKVLADVKQHTETLMVKTWNLKQNQTLVTTDLSGVQHDCNSVEITITPAVMDKDGNVTTPAEKITIDDK